MSNIFGQHRVGDPLPKQANTVNSATIKQQQGVHGNDNTGTIPGSTTN